MTQQQSVVLAAVLRVPDFERWEALLEHANPRMLELGVMRRWAYQSISDPTDVFAGVLVSSAEQAMAMMRGHDMTDWLLRAGVQDVPPFFVGGRVASFDLTQGQRVDGKYVVATIHSVRDYDRWMATVEADRPWLVDGGTRHVWIYRAIDDPVEVMGMMSVSSQAAAQALQAGGRRRELWFDESDLDVHPQVFVGRRSRLVDFDQALRSVD